MEEAEPAYECPEQSQPAAPIVFEHGDPQDTGLVSWSHHERGSPQNDHPARSSGRVIPVAGQSEQSKGVRAHPMSPSEDQALPDPSV